MSFGGISTGDLAEFGLELGEQFVTPTLTLQREEAGSGGFGRFELSRFDDFQTRERQEGAITGLGDLETSTAETLSEGVANLRGGISSSLDTSRDILSESADLRGELGALAEQVTPGFGRLTAAARSSIRDAAAREAGDLRAQFARRKLSGSQFAINEQRRLALDFALEEEEAVADAFVEELDLQRAVFADIANVLQLDIDTLAEQANLLLLELGASELELENFRFELDIIKEISDELNELALLELEELALVGNIANGVSAVVGSTAAANAAEETTGLDVFDTLLGSVGISGTFDLGSSDSAAGAVGSLGSSLLPF